VATWRIWPSTSGPAITADTTAYSLSTEFAVTSAGCSITGYYYWLPTTGTTVAKTLSLWSVTTGTTGTRITAANATSAVQTAGAWNFTACTSTALTSGQHYRAEVTYTQGTNNWYGVTASYWSSGGGASNIVNGPLTAYSAANATGGIQGGFLTSATVGFTTGTSGNGNYWIDVQIDDGGGAAVRASVAMAQMTGF
jgi:hypothetical protein